MIKKRISKLILPVLIILSITFVASKYSDIYFEIAKNIDIFTKVYKEVTFNYVDKINAEQFLRAGIKGMLSALDPYTVFIDENRQDDIDILTNGKYGGIGVSIGVKDSNITIMELMDGYSAQRQGVRVGDIILEVDNHPVFSDDFENVSSLVKGEPGSTLELKILRNEKKDTLIFNLVREEIQIKNITYYNFIPENSNYAYVKLTGFSRTASEELKKALLDLMNKKNIEGVILDLRGNPGGLLDVAVDIVNKFIPKGELIVSTKGRDANSIKHYYASQEPLIQKTKLVLLVNDGSASASEIVAGAIQDHDRGIVVGTQTFGKGLVQTISPLSYNTSLKITTAKYYTPSGRCIQKIDYSNKNSVIAEYDSLIETPFSTDNKRKVFSSGGITPDSIIQPIKILDLTQDLLAKGIFFSFANDFYNKNLTKDFYSFKDDFLFNEFLSFLKNQNYHYTSELSEEFKNILNYAETNKSYENMKTKILQLKNEIEQLDNKEINNGRKEIIEQIKIELASRYYGNEGRIKQTLENDNQYKVALDFLKNINLYNQFLSNH